MAKFSEVRLNNACAQGLRKTGSGGSTEPIKIWSWGHYYPHKELMSDRCQSNGHGHLSVSL